MQTSRLGRSTNAPMRDVASIKDFCNHNRIPYSDDYYEKIVPTDELQKRFQTYRLSPLIRTGLKEKGASSVLVFENKEKLNGNDDAWSHHGEACAAIAHRVGTSLSEGVDSLYIHTSLNPNYREAFDREHLESVKNLIENQGIPVIHTSIGWSDKLLDFETWSDQQADHLWRVTAFLVDSAGNEGILGEVINGVIQPPPPRQKHNALTHYAPLVVHVGAAAMDEKGKWHIEGYSSANSPTFLAPVASSTEIHWDSKGEKKPILGSSAAAPYVSGSLSALNREYGAYLTREQILYAVISTCTPINHVTKFIEKDQNKKPIYIKTPEDKTIKYETNGAGLLYNPEYGGFGLVHIHAADKLLAQMVAMTQENPESVTVPTEERVTLLNCSKEQKADDGLYHYMVKMPAGIALKTTIEAEFNGENGDITITSPSGTKLPMVMSKLISDTKHFGMSTCHGFAGEKLEGEWWVTSTTPIKRLRLNQHHFLEKDIVKDIGKIGRRKNNVEQLLSKTIPYLSNAIPLRELMDEHRALNVKVLPKHAVSETLHLRGDNGVSEPFVRDDIDLMIGQLQKLPTGYSERHRIEFFPTFTFADDSKGYALEKEVGKLAKGLGGDNHDALSHQIIAKQISAADEYAKEGIPAAGIMPLMWAAGNYLACRNIYDEDGKLNAEKAIPIYQKALKICEDNNLYHKAYEVNNLLYSAVSSCCEQGKADEYAYMLPQVRQKAVQLARNQQGGVDDEAYRIEEGEFGFSNKEKIGTDNVSQCLTIIAQDPQTLKTGLVHLDNENDVKTLDKFFAKFSDERLKIRLVGARFDTDPKTRENIHNVMEYLSHKNADIISADIYGGNDGHSAVVVDPKDFSLTEKVPTKHNENEPASNAIILFTQDGKPLIDQFDFTKTSVRNPIHLNTRMLSEIRKCYIGKKEWQIERFMNSIGLYNIPLMVGHMLGLEKSYNQEWTRLNQALDDSIAANIITGGGENQARQALLKQSIFIGENAQEANAPIYDWIKNRLFKNGELQWAELKGPTSDLNIYDETDKSKIGSFSSMVTNNNNTSNWQYLN